MTMTFEQHEANIKALEAAANTAYGFYDRAERRGASDEECRKLWAEWRTAQDAWEASLKAKEERRQAFLKLLKG